MPRSGAAVPVRGIPPRGERGRGMSGTDEAVTCHVLHLGTATARAGKLRVIRHYDMAEELRYHIRTQSQLSVCPVWVVVGLLVVSS